MKKVLSVFIAITVMITSLTAFASQSEDMEKVLLSVKERIENTDSYNEFNSSVYTLGNNNEYSFDWATYEEDTRKSLNITATDSGIIKSYRKYDENTYSYRINPSLNKMPTDVAMEKTEALINKLNPIISGKFRLIKTSSSESLFEDTYRFNLQRYENDIPVYGDTGYVTVNKDATEIIRYSINYTEDLSFENSANLLGIEDVWDTYINEIGAEIQYVIDYSDEEKITLAYFPCLNGDEFIDAKTGDVTNIWYRDYHYSTNDKNMAAGGMVFDAAVEESGRLSEIEIEKLEEISGLKSVEDAVDAILNAEIFDLESDLTLNSVNLFNDDKENYFYDLRFQNQSDKEYRYASATIDAKTLEIIRWRAKTNGSLYYEAHDKELDKKDIVTKAQKVLEILAPDYYEEYRLKETEEISNNLSYVRYVNNIVFKNDIINVEINPENGKVWAYNKSYTNKEFISPDSIISKENAIRSMSKQAEMTLYYFPYADEKTAYNANFAKLGYMSEYVERIDAFTGKVHKYSVEDSKLTYNDIDNHYAKDEIETLAKFGIGFEGEEFKPNDKITQKEYLSLLIATFSNYSPIILKNTDAINEEYKQAQRIGVVLPNEIAPNEPLTREKAAIYMIRVMGVEEIAKLPGIYKSVFSDVNDNVGYISILGAMRVFNGDENGHFNPTQNLTRADAAILIFNYLSR